MGRIWSAALLSLALAACDSPTMWSDDLVIEIQAAQDTEEAAAVMVASGGVVVRGVYLAPASGYRLAAYYQVTGDEVALFVDGHPPEPGDAPGGISGHAYRLSIPLDRGTYTVRVVHRDEDGGGVRRREVGSAEVTVGRS